MSDERVFGFKLNPDMRRPHPRYMRETGERFDQMMREIDLTYDGTVECARRFMDLCEKKVANHTGMWPIYVGSWEAST